MIFCLLQTSWASSRYVKGFYPRRYLTGDFHVFTLLLYMCRPKQLDIGASLVRMEEYLISKMTETKTMLTAIIGLCITILGATAQNIVDISILPAGCHYENQEVVEIVYDEVFEKKCFQENK